MVDVVEHLSIEFPDFSQSLFEADFLEPKGQQRKIVSAEATVPKPAILAQPGPVARSLVASMVVNRSVVEEWPSRSLLPNHDPVDESGKAVPHALARGSEGNDVPAGPGRPAQGENSPDVTVERSHR
jgi:hypothetical protein